MLSASEPAKLDWTFPIARTHAGVPQGNGRMGTLVWGQGRTLCLTLGRADAWDHRGGLLWDARHAFADIRACLERDDRAGMRRLFAQEVSPGQPVRPTILPLGRIEIDLPPRAELEAAELDLAHGELQIRVRMGRTHSVLRAWHALDADVWVLELPLELADVSCRAVPAWQFVGEADLAPVGYRPPETLRDPDLAGWFQACPADPGVAVGWSRAGRRLLVGTTRAADAASGMEALRVQMQRGRAVGAWRRTVRQWWKAFWSRTPAVCLPDARLRELLRYGLYKFALLTRPEGVAATLQGAWVEEYQMPPWSNDYHFNINVQMCYWPAFRSNHLEHLLPLFRMIESWMPRLRHNAKVFLGIEDGIMLPHAVDDRCVCMGGFWAGAIDHGCTAWVGDMMYRYVRATGDMRFLRKTAYPFLCGAMRVYEGMLERGATGPTLPVSVSPEYRGADPNAWGRNASFQLACLHRLAENLIAAAARLRTQPDPVWLRIRDELPKATLLGPAGAEEIALWEGTPLEESHRHHSHLAGLCPFDVWDTGEPVFREILERSLQRWVRKGAGLWSGWCIPWAAMLHTRVDNAEAAVLWLHLWQEVYTNEGRGTLHDPHFPGFSLLGKGGSRPKRARREIMQMDAGMACVAAIYDLLLHERRGVVHLFAGAPEAWGDVSFRDVRTEDGMRVSARRLGGRVEHVEVEADVAGVLRLALPWVEGAVVAREGRKHVTVAGPVANLRLPRGTRVTLLPNDIR